MINIILNCTAVICLIISGFLLYTNDFKMAVAYWGLAVVAAMIKNTFKKDLGEK